MIVTKKKELKVVGILVLILNGMASLPALAGGGAGVLEPATYFQRFFKDGGPLVWFVLLPLSVITISLIVQHFLVIRRGRLIPAGAADQVDNLLSERRGPALLEYLQEQDDFLSRTLYVSLAEAKNGRVAMENAMSEMLEQQSTSLLRKIEWLNIIGNVAPMIGLFGTVWGMIEAFNRIVHAQGQPDAEQLAGAISIALVTTLWGLFAAIPALTAYGSLRNRIDALTAEVALATEDMIRRFQTT
ncbi:MAG: MotA/TolQ/ExbB proton channel family protein [Planctomycetes bacterium]|nr:MotA/TolQ/ExbB proton channel family protein [Planctomycetota bacterium]